MHYHAAYIWLENQGLWKAVIGWLVGTVFGTVFVRRSWMKHRKAQADIADSLNTKTPGGLTEVSDQLKVIARILRSNREGNEDEDNPDGSQMGLRD